MKPLAVRLSTVAPSAHRPVSAVAPWGRFRLPSENHLIWGLLAASVAAIVSALPLALTFPFGRVWFLLVLHILALGLPITHVAIEYQQRRDLFHPQVVASATFAVFHVLFAPFVLVTPVILSHRGLDRFRPDDLLLFAAVAYGVLLVAWLAYLVGYKLGRAFAWPLPRLPGRSSPLFLAVGLVFVALGIMGNIGFLGSIDLYFEKILRPYERWEVYEQRAADGGTAWSILIRFLPLGTFVTAYGLWLKTRRRTKVTLAILLLAAGVSNSLLSSATGGRGIMLWTALFGLVILSTSMKMPRPAVVLGALVGLVGIAFLLGQLREAASFGRAVVFDSSDAFARLVGLYLSNFVGTLTLAGEVQQSGTVDGATALSGLTGLLGGPTPTTTQMEIWYRLTGSYEGSNPRYGPPGELFFNYGWLGVVAGMTVIGVAVAALSKVYERVRGRPGIASATWAVFAVFTANFLIIANLSYLPPYLTYYSAPFYLTFVLFRFWRT